MNRLPDWAACQSRLEALLQLTEKAQEAAIASLSSGHADDFVARCGDLSRVLVQEQAGLVHALAQPGAPVAVQQLLHQVQTGLNVLQDTTARLQAGNQRALGVLFPPDQVRTYSQLGAKGYGAPGRSSGTSFKA
jgi:hypothetical protein